MRKFIILLIVIVCNNCFGQVNNISVTYSLQQYATTVNNTNANNYAKSLTVFTPKEDTQGWPYLFQNWVGGKVELITNQTFNEKSPILNYDKTTGKLIMLLDNKTVIEVNMEQVKNFTLEDSSVKYRFCNLDMVPPKFVIELYKDSLSGVYKDISTKFYKSDYVNKGIYESGYKYDRFVDEYQYYFVHNRITTRIKAIDKSELKNLIRQYPTTKKFLSENPVPENKEERENYLIRLTNYITTNDKG